MGDSVAYSGQSKVWRCGEAVSGDAVGSEYEKLEQEEARITKE